VQSAVFLDRDNTLILNDGDLGDPESVRLLAGVPEALATLRDAGFTLVVVTNQGGVARGQFTEDDVRAVHRRIGELVDRIAGRRDLIARFYHCPFHPQGCVPAYTREHPWRKPSPGMLLQAAADLSLDLDRSWMIGDAARDVEAGWRAGCRTVLLGACGERASAATTGEPSAGAATCDAAMSAEESPGAARRPSATSTSRSPIEPCDTLPGPDSHPECSPERRSEGAPDFHACDLLHAAEIIRGQRLLRLTELQRSDELRP